MNIDRTLTALPSMSAEQRKRLRDNAERWRDTGTAEQRGAATRVLDAMSAQTESEQQSLLRQLGGMDVSTLVAEAFRAVPMTDTERKLIQVLLDNPGFTSTKLSAALGWGEKSWHMHFGKMCKKRAVYLWPAPWAEQRGADFYSGILADFGDYGSGFTVKPAVAAAFAAMGIKAHSA